MAIRSTLTRLVWSPEPRRPFDCSAHIDAPVKEPAGKARVIALARELLPAGQARDYNQALMELGALVCRPKNPDCSACPVAGAGRHWYLAREPL